LNNERFWEWDWRDNVEDIGRIEMLKNYCRTRALKNLVDLRADGG